MAVWILAAVLVAGAVVGGTATVLRSRADRPVPVLANRRPVMLPSATPAPAATVRTPDGRTVQCPTGAEPGIMLTAVWFTPALTGGSALGTGTYQIELRGMVQNG
jgi:hypothetical protein